MNAHIKEFKTIIADSKFQAGISAIAGATAIVSPPAAAVLGVFKEIASVADSIRCDYIVKGLASGLNIEKFTNELATYVSQSEENAFYVSSTLRKAMLADSKKVCSLMARILADHVRDKIPYDRNDIIIVRALESATDEDIALFKEIMHMLDNETVTINGDDKYMECIDWGLSNRLFKQEEKGFEDNYWNLGVDTKAFKASYKLAAYIKEIKQLFRSLE